MCARPSMIFETFVNFFLHLPVIVETCTNTRTHVQHMIRHSHRRRRWTRAPLTCRRRHLRWVRVVFLCERVVVFSFVPRHACCEAHCVFRMTTFILDPKTILAFWICHSPVILAMLCVPEIWRFCRSCLTAVLCRDKESIRLKSLFCKLVNAGRRWFAMLSVEILSAILCCIVHTSCSGYYLGRYWVCEFGFIPISMHYASRGKDSKSAFTGFRWFIWNRISLLQSTDDVNKHCHRDNLQTINDPTLLFYCHIPIVVYLIVLFIKTNCTTTVVLFFSLK